jgi:hypothetical protein
MKKAEMLKVKKASHQIAKLDQVVQSIQQTPPKTPKAVLGNVTSNFVITNHQQAPPQLFKHYSHVVEKQPIIQGNAGQLKLQARGS